MIAMVGLAVVLASWSMMLLVLGINHVRLRRAPAMQRRSSRTGLVLQAIAYGAVFGVRPPAAVLFGAWPGSTRLIVWVAIVISVAGAAIVIWSQRALGEQWSLTARLIEQHRLITTGPYRYVRHPIYAAMLPMMTATGLALTTPVILTIALVVYLVGTRIRISAEETLMEEAFGAEWRAYRQRTGALVPHPRRNRS